MDKGGYGNDSNNSSNRNRDMYLKQINKNSHKISKQSATNRNKPLLPPPPPPAMAAALSVPPPIIDPPNPQPQSQQPPVYNINKNDFRDVVQKLTGSPAHDHRSPPPPPPPITHSRPPSSRLQRIRPPPLSQIASQRAASPPAFAPLPPLPAVHPAAESPISAYMRFLQTSSGGPSPAPPPPMDSPVSAYMRFLQNSANTSSPRWNAAPPAPHQPFPAPPLSPLPFGCVPSPRSGFGMLSPSFLLSPTGGQLGLPQLPLSPTLPSPRWKGM